MDVQISVHRDDAGREANGLAEWLRRERDLPTAIDVVPRPAAPGNSALSLTSWWQRPHRGASRSRWSGH